ncbi:hypothetical protein Ancab_004767 [Ancistrocladus abbreviatus]
MDHEHDKLVRLHSVEMGKKISKHHKLLVRSLFFLSVSLFSLFLPFFTDLSFVHACNHFFSAFISPLLVTVIHTFERKYMLLLCNLILVFLTGKFGLRGSEQPQSDQLQIEIMNNIDEDVLVPATVIPDQVQAHNDGDHISEQERGEQESDQCMNVGVEERESEDCLRKEEEEEEEGEIELERDDMTAVEAGDQMENEGAASSTDELNKKFEEFIRKMKEELRLEAQQQQLIAA